MSNYPADFAAPAPYEPVEPDVFLWMPPMLIGALALAALAIAALAWWMGRSAAARDPDAAEDIWTAIADACNAAVAANTEEKAKALRREIADRLGPVLSLAEGVSKPVKDLDAAIKGKKKAPAGAGGPLAPGAGVTVLSNSHVVINPAGEDGKGKGDKPAPPPPAKDEDMSVEERADAIRLAVGRFHDYWKLKEARLADLRAARRALCHTAPVKRIDGHGKGH